MSDIVVTMRTAGMSMPPTLSPASASAEDVSSRTDAQACVLRVSGLPSALSVDAVTSLLSHYGATHVRVLRRKKPGAVLHGAVEPLAQTAIAEFPSRERLVDAQQRLAGVHLAGRQLTVEEPSAKDDAPDGPIGTSENDIKKQAIDQQANGNAAGPVPPVPAPNAPVPLAPHLGLHYAPSPLLQYKYPKATVPIVRNIANALIALPRFYTQVLHLMNKMNLPTPFELDAIPGRFSEEWMPELRYHSQRIPSQSTDQVVEEDEEEEDDPVEPPTASKRGRLGGDDAVSGAGKKRPRVAIGAPHSSDTIKPPRPGVISATELARQRLSDAARVKDPVFADYAMGAPSCRVRVGNVAESVDVSDLAYVFGYVLPLAFPLESMAIERSTSSGSAIVTFPTLESAVRAVEQINGVVVDGQPLVVSFEEPKSFPPPEPSATNNAESWERMDSSLLSQEKAMKNYQRGEPSAALYLKNLTKAVDETVLRSLCRPWLTPSISVDSLSIRHFTEGRMKNQAFIEFPSTETAAAVLEGIHGLVVHGKPLVVSFRKAPTSQAPLSTQQNG